MDILVSKRHPNPMEAIYSCEGKVRLQSWTRAAQVARRQSQRHHAKFSAYACEHCGGFHVGSHIGEPGGSKGRAGKPYRYIVFAAEGSGPEVLFGWSNAPDGGAIAKIVTTQPGWRITRVVERKDRRAA